MIKWVVIPLNTKQIDDGEAGAEKGILKRYLVKHRPTPVRRGLRLKSISLMLPRIKIVPNIGTIIF